MALLPVGTVMCSPCYRVRGDERLDANVKAAVGVQPLIPPDRAHWPRYITASTERFEWRLVP